MKKIIKNRAKCLICGDVLVSKTTKDIQYCQCRNVFISGGLERLQRDVIDTRSFIDLSIFENESNHKRNLKKGF